LNDSQRKLANNLGFSAFHSFTDAVIEEQVWKTQIDLTIFQDLMADCNDFDYDRKSRYIRFTQALHITQSGDSEQEEAATGGDVTAAAAAADDDEPPVIAVDPVEEQMFLETTV